MTRTWSAGVYGHRHKVTGTGQRRGLEERPQTQMQSRCQCPQSDLREPPKPVSHCPSGPNPSPPACLLGHPGLESLGQLRPPLDLLPPCPSPKAAFPATFPSADRKTAVPSSQALPPLLVLLSPQRVESPPDLLFFAVVSSLADVVSRVLLYFIQAASPGPGPQPALKDWMNVGPQAAWKEPWGGHCPAVGCALSTKS